MASASILNEEAIIIIDSDDDTTKAAPVNERSNSSGIQPMTLESQKSLCLVESEQLPPASSSRSRPLDEQTDATEVFRKFASLCESCIGKNTDGKSVLMILNKRYKKASKTYRSSRDFRELLEAACAKIAADRGNIFVHIKEVVAELRAYRDVKKEHVIVPEQEQSSHNGIRQAFPLSDSVRRLAAEDVGTNDATSTSHAPPRPQSLHSRSDDAADATLAELVSATIDGGESIGGTSEHVSAQIEKLEHLLGKYSRAIQRYEEKELSLDDLLKSSSDYIIEGKLKARADKIFKQLCSLKGRNYHTGRALERKFKYSGTRYPEMNKKIQSFINKHGSWEERMPDYHDIHRIVCACNARYKLELTKNRLTDLATEVFTDVGTMLQQQRHDDFVSSFGSHLTDPYRSSDDPALYDKDLKCQLDTNRARGLKRLDEVINKYASIKEEEVDVSQSSKSDARKKKVSSVGTSVSSDGSVKIDRRTNGDKPLTNSSDSSKSREQNTPSEGHCTSSRPGSHCATSLATVADASEPLSCVVLSKSDDHLVSYDALDGVHRKSSA